MVRPIWKPEDKGTQVMQSKKGMSILGLKWCKEGLRMDLREEHKKNKTKLSSRCCILCEQTPLILLTWYP